MQYTVAGNDRTVLQVCVRTVQCRCDSARFTHDEESGRYVPWRKRQFPKGIEPPPCDVAQIQRSGALSVFACSNLRRRVCKMRMSALCEVAALAAEVFK